MPLSLSLLPDRLAVCRLDADAEPPDLSGATGLWSVTRTGSELSIVVAESEVRPEWRAKTGWRALEVRGPLPFEMTGVLASLATPLAEAGVSLFAVSTHDTDYLLVQEDALEAALAALRDAGHEIGARA